MRISCSQDVTLFYTTVVFGATNERATVSNGSMASSRVINMNRSPNPILYIYLKFSVETKYEKIQIFEQALRQFVMGRPREWSNFIAFRATEIRAEQGYIGELYKATSGEFSRSHSSPDLTNFSSFRSQSMSQFYYM